MASISASWQASLAHTWCLRRAGALNVAGYERG